MSQHLIECKIQSDWHIPLCVRSPDLVARSLLRAPTPPNLSLNLFAFLATEQTWPHTRLLPVARSSSFQLQRNQKIRSYLGSMFCLHGKWSFQSQHLPKYWNFARTGISNPFEKHLLLVLAPIKDVLGWAWVVLGQYKTILVDIWCDSIPYTSHSIPQTPYKYSMLVICPDSDL